MAFATPATLIPAFAERLGAPNLLIGAIPALMTAGWMLPAVFAANYTQSLARKLPFILKYTVFERISLPAARAGRDLPRAVAPDAHAGCCWSCCSA